MERLNAEAMVTAHEKGYKANYFSSSNFVVDFYFFFMDNCNKVYLIVKVESLIWSCIASFQNGSSNCIEGQ